MRRSRVYPERATTLGGVIGELAGALREVEKKIGSIGGVWAEVCPPELQAKTMVEGISRGVATIRVRDSATRFELDRLLRAGMERQLVKRCPTTLRKVKLIIGEVG